MSPVTEGKLRLGGMALRNGLLVHGPTHWAAAVRDKQGRDPRRVRPQAARARRRRRPGRARRRAARRGVRRDPARQEGAARRQAPVREPGRDRRRGRGVARRRPAAQAAARRRRRDRRGARLAGARGVRAARRRAGPVPRRRAQGDRRLRGARRRDGRGRHRQGARPLRLAPGRADARLQRGGHACCCARAVERPGPLAGSAVALASTAAAVEVFAWCERNSESRTGARDPPPGFEIQRVVGTREPDERQLEVGRAPRWRRSCAWKASRRGWTLTSSSSAPGSRAWWRRRSWPTRAGA